MIQYAECRLKEDESGNYQVRGVFQNEFLPEFDPRQNLIAIDVTDMQDKPQQGDTYFPDTDTFDVTPEPPSPPDYTLNVLVDDNKEVVVSTNTNVIISVTALKDGIKTTDFDGNIHYVPIFDIDNTKKKLLKVALSNGEFSTTFNSDSEGIFTVNTDKIYPKVTQATIPNKPVIVVE